MQKRTLKVALLAVLTVLLVLGVSGVALADQTWPDLPDSITAKYAVDDNQVAAISDGFASGLWKPFQNVTRAQFTKMAVAAFNIPLVDPAVASYTDVPKGSQYYQDIEAAKAAGIVSGTSATTFGPKTPITRQQALAIVARYVADANGYDLATMYTAAEIDALLSHFGDAASISADLRDEMAFAFDFGLTVGNDLGNLDPLANLTRIQGAVMLIRAQAKVPPAQWTAANIELVDAATSDKSENLIGVSRSLTYKVTTADGHPAIRVLVDFDTLSSNDFYVGNVSNEAALTDNFGQVTINLLSTEPGTERVSATVNGVGTIYTTAYWLALDEVYLLGENADSEYEYNAGVTSTALGARAVVFGPGPLSTSAQDWYNAYKPNTTGALAAVDWPLGWVVAEINALYKDLLPMPGEELTEDDLDELYAWAQDWADDHEALILGIETADSETLEIVKLVNLILSVDRWTVDVEELATAHGYTPRGLAGISMYWNIVNVVENDPKTVTKDETVASVGDIVEVDGVAQTAAKSAVGTTDATGKSTIKLTSQVTGKTKVQVVADYAGNPYSGQLFNHLTSQIGLHFLDWDDQPYQAATTVITWIPHVIGGDESGPITAANLVNNTGEVEEFTLNLEDTYGNAIPGYTVVWWLEGVGFFKTDDSSWAGVGEVNKDFDITDATGKATVWVKSLEPGQTVVHCKVMDKYGSTYKEWNLTKQWYSIDRVDFIDALVWTDLDDDGKVDVLLGEMAPPVNAVNSGHTFTAQVTGAKWVHVLYDLNSNGLLDDQALLGKRSDIKAAEGAVVVMVNNVFTLAPKLAGADILPGQVFTPDVYDDNENGVIDDAESKEGLGEDTAWYTRFADTELGAAEFWADIYGTDLLEDQLPTTMDGISEVWCGLKGKTVYFYTNIGNGGIPTSNTPLTTISGGAFPLYVGSITSTTPVVTDDMGKAQVSINSTVKGTQWVYAVADYLENPQDGDPLRPYDSATVPDDGWQELRWASAVKIWGAGGGETAVIFAQGVKQDDLRWANPVLATTRGTDGVIASPDKDRIAVQVFDTYGNALEGYKVTFEIVGQGTTTSGYEKTYHPFAHFDYVATEDTGTPALEKTPNHDWLEIVPGPYGSLLFPVDPSVNDIQHYAGVGDLNPYWNSNWWWGDDDWMLWDTTDLTDEEYDELNDPSDDDYAWGWTLNHEINFKYNEASAAYADLVLDETQTELIGHGVEYGATHYTSIVNIKIYKPDGTFWKQYEVTKVWSLDTPVLASVALTISTSATGPWVTSLQTSLRPIYYQAVLLDQFGDPYTGTVPGGPVLLRISNGSTVINTSALAMGGSDTDGVLTGDAGVPNLDGTYSITAFYDANNNTLITSGEPTSAVNTVKTP